MGVEERRMQRIFLVFAVAAMISCIAGSSVVWQYESNSSGDSGGSSQETPQVQSFDSPGSNGSLFNESFDLSKLDRTAASSGSSSAASGSLWSWGSTPRGFSVNNGTLEYPDDYYTSHFNLGYGDSGIEYGQTKLQNLSRYATGFSTGYYGGNSIYSLLADGKSTYDPWNNYHGYDPNYPYGYPSS